MLALHRRVTSSLITLALCLGVAAPAVALTPGQLCEKKAAIALRKCGKGVIKRSLKCQQQTGASCLPADSEIAGTLATLEENVLDACPDAPTMAAAGYPVALTPAGLVDRLQVACADAAASLVARSFGGPHAAVRSGASATDVACLDYAYDQGRKMIDYALRQQSRCVLSVHKGGTCDTAKVGAKIVAREAKVSAAIAARCADLASLVTVDPATFVARASDQAECLVATAHAQSAPLSLACGPRAAVPVPPLATATQIVLANATWGTRCGDGTDYAFWLRLAPAGQPVGKVVVFLVGGGNCVDGPQCAGTPADLFEAVADTMGQSAIMSSTASTSPFVNWTKVYLPYCTQDLHTGGGITNVFTEMTVHRYGALNVRASLRYVRDVLWASMDATDPEGFRPDRLTVLFSGSSAGGGGAAFNYHYLLDDLRWTHSTLLPDSALGMDNGTGAAALRGAHALNPVSPGWAALPYAAPYCSDPECAELFPVLQLATAPRLKVVPEQQILNVSNQTDNVQRNVGGFGTTQNFVNTLRTKYCEVQGTPGIHSFFSAQTAWIHGQINASEYNNNTAEGILLRDWIGAAMTSPDSVTDLIDTGTLEVDFPGVNPFPCPLD